jgi:hypothetical protein
LTSEGYARLYADLPDLLDPTLRTLRDVLRREAAAHAPGLA